MSNVTVKTNRYEASHGHKPKGIGQWWFEDKNQNNVYESTWCESYTDAKRSAMAKAKDLGLSEIYVSP